MVKELKNLTHRGREDIREVIRPAKKQIERLKGEKGKIKKCFLICPYSKEPGL